MVNLALGEGRGMHELDVDEDRQPRKYTRENGTEDKAHL